MESKQEYELNKRDCSCRIEWNERGLLGFTSTRWANMCVIYKRLLRQINVPQLITGCHSVCTMHDSRASPQQKKALTDKRIT